jgi:acyl-CoA synthetase (AMP-forming)/AMP-acid ligase II
MRYRDVERRLTELEAEARRKEAARVEALSQEELEAEIARYPLDPELEAAMDALSFEQLEIVAAGKIPEKELRRWYRERQKGQG